MELAKKRVAVFGLGKSGISTVKLLHKFQAELVVIDRGDPKTWSAQNEISPLVSIAQCFDQENAFEAIESVELVILSPGIPREHKLLQRVHELKIPVISEIELASWYTDAPIIAITGSNGKTTTTSMIGMMIKKSGKSVFVGGNIGIPFCDMILNNEKPDYIVLELSSFQLESIDKFHPKVALILNLFQNHGERYEQIEDYGQAKFNLLKNMERDDWLIAPSNFKLINELASNYQLNKVSIDIENRILVENKLNDSYKMVDFKLHGYHNRLNLLFAHHVAEILQLPRVGMQSMIREFLGVEHRLQFIPSSDPFISFNDAKSTNWDALRSAVTSIDKNGRELWVIIGGRKRGRDDSITPHLTLLKNYIDRILLIGETEEQFVEEIGNTISVVGCKNLETAVRYSRENGLKGILLLSPAFPSYDQYANFNKRGEHFIKLISGKG